MRVKPNLNHIRKTKYRITIEDQVFDTWASDEQAAVSNAAFRYAEENDEEVGIVAWKIRTGEFYYDVEEEE